MTISNKNELRVTRITIVQSIYAFMEMAPHKDDDYAEILEYRIKTQQDDTSVTSSKIDVEYAHKIFDFAIKQEIAIKKIIDKFLLLGWNVNNMDSLLLAIIWTFVSDIYCNQDIENKILISEYVQIAGGFFGDKECGFINKTLDLISRERKKITDDLSL